MISGPPSLARTGRDAAVDVAVVGAGAAGMVAAVFAVSAGRRVLLLERTRDGGRKILVSGGGRCNVLPSVLAPERFVSDSSPNTLRKMLVSWPLAEQRRFFEDEVGLPLALEPETGKLFPASDRARDVRDGLLRLAGRRGVILRTGAEVAEIRPPASPAGTWTVGLRGGEGIAAAAVVLATGGLSMPGTGSDGAGLAWAGALGHTVHATYPALTPLTASRPDHAALAGISREVTLQAPGAGKGEKSRSTRGGFLFTHRGYSGPAVLDLSHLAVRARLAGRSQPLLVQWTHLETDAWDRLLQEGNGTIAALLRRELPDRLAALLLAEAGVDGGSSLARLRRDDRRRLAGLLGAYPLPWSGDEGYAKAEVTGGGVALAEVAPRTLESRLHPGLFLCGEMLDAFGPIGGHNFAWAWATGRAAGLGAAGASVEAHQHGS